MADTNPTDTYNSLSQQKTGFPQVGGYIAGSLAAIAGLIFAIINHAPATLKYNRRHTPQTKRVIEK